MLLVFLNFNLDIGSVRIGLIPTFLGYMIMARGLNELTHFSGRFAAAAPFVKGMTVYSVIIYAMDLFGISSLLGDWIALALGLVSTVMSLYISYNIIMGVMDIENSRAADLCGARLLSAWKLLAVFSVLSLVLYAFPALFVISVIVSLIASIMYLVVFNRSKNQFYEQNLY